MKKKSAKLQPESDNLQSKKKTRRPPINIKINFLTKLARQLKVSGLVILFLSLPLALALFSTIKSRQLEVYQQAEASPSPSPSAPLNPVNWQTEQVSLEADDFYIVANGEKFLGDPQTMTVQSDPGDASYTTLELIWLERGREMRLFIYFHGDADQWWASELRTYDGQWENPDWIDYKNGPYFISNLGSVYRGDVNFEGDENNQYPGEIHFGNLRLMAFVNRTLKEPRCGQSTIPPDSPGLAPLTVFLHGSGYAAGGDSLIGYQWDFDGNGVWDSDVILEPVNHTYTQPGTYLPQFRVKSSQGLWSDVCLYPYEVVVLSPEARQLKFKIKFAGIDAKPVITVSRWVFTSFANPETTDPFYMNWAGDIPFMLKPEDEDQGFYHGEITIDRRFLTQDGFADIYLKGPAHRRLKFTHVNMMAEEEIDLTYRELEPGDLKEPELGQDGVVNFHDIDVLKARLLSRDPTDLEIADLNLDSIVNVGDLMLIFETLSFKPDE